jgi:hypothetical protein
MIVEFNSLNSFYPNSHNKSAYRTIKKRTFHFEKSLLPIIRLKFIRLKKHKIGNPAVMAETLDPGLCVSAFQQVAIAPYSIDEGF